MMPSTLLDCAASSSFFQLLLGLLNQELLLQIVITPTRQNVGGSVLLLDGLCLFAHILEK